MWSLLCVWLSGFFRWIGIELLDRLRSLAHGLFLDSLWSFVCPVLSAWKKQGHQHRKGRNRKPRTPRGRARRRARKASLSPLISPVPSLPSVAPSSSASNVPKERARKNKVSGKSKQHGKNGNKKHGNKKNRAQKMKPSSPVSSGIEPMKASLSASSPASSPAPSPTPSVLLARAQKKAVPTSSPSSPRASVTQAEVASARAVPVGSAIPVNSDVSDVPTTSAKPAGTDLYDDPEIAMIACICLAITAYTMTRAPDLPEPEPGMEEL